jgi:hypothetical protein
MKIFTKLIFLASFLMFVRTSSAQHVIDTNAIIAAYLQSDYIFEGTIESQCTFADPNTGNIYTANKVYISKIIKGELSCGTVKIITLGGEFEGHHLDVSHTVQFVPGVTGIFVCKDSYYTEEINCPYTNNNEPLMLTYSYHGSLEYLFDRVNSEVNGLNSYFATLDEFYNFLSTIGINIIVCDASVIEQKRIKARQSIQSEVFYHPIKEYSKEENTNFEYYTTRVNNSKNTALNKAGEEIEFQISSATIVNNQYKIDISVRSNVNSTYLDGVAFRLKYNKFATGANISSATTLALGSNFSSSFYDNLTTTNFKDSILEVRIINLAGSPNRTQLTTSFKKLVTLTIPINNCKVFGNFKIDTFSNFNNWTAFANSATAPWMPGVLFNYEKRVFGSTNQGEQCIPDITSINKYNVIGGNKEQVTITGNYFGNTRGQLFMKNVDTDNNPNNLQNGPKYIPLDQIDIISWSNTQITFYVPSTVDSAWFNGGAYTRRIAGTGFIRVKDNSGLVSEDLSNSIYVNYSLFNLRKNTYKQNQYLFSANSDGKYHFKLNSSITNSGMINCIEAAFRKWSCNTGVSFVLDNGTVTTEIANDNVNVITISNVGSDSSFIARTFSRGVDMCSNNSTQPFPTNEIDIQINQYFLNSFQYDTTGSENISPGLIDFFSVILHEIGHAHLLHHVGDQTDLMYYANSRGPISAPNRKINFTNNNLNGGDEIVTRSSIQNYGLICNYNLPIIPITKNCRTTGLFNIETKNDNIKIYPNPFEENISIQLKSAKSEYVNIIIQNLLGQTFSELKVLLVNGENEINLPVELKNGIYLINISGNNISYTAKLICTK